MRGKRSTSDSCNSSIRITPADAGKTLLILPLCGLPTDHPRGCGENCRQVAARLFWLGSPPRMRGKRQNTDKTNKRTGITPADAGKTSDRYSRRRHGKDHPRGCGENRLHEGCLVVLLGSPPRMRGKLHVCGKRQQHLRITPADAGKTQKRLDFCSTIWDHPRGCGENPLCLRA